MYQSSPDRAAGPPTPAIGDTLVPVTRNWASRTGWHWTCTTEPAKHFAKQGEDACAPLTSRHETAAQRQRDLAARRAAYQVDIDAAEFAAHHEAAEEDAEQVHTTNVFQLHWFSSIVVSLRQCEDRLHDCSYISWQLPADEMPALIGQLVSSPSYRVWRSAFAQASDQTQTPTPPRPKQLPPEPQATAVAPVEGALTPQALQLMRPSQQQRQVSQQQEAAQRDPSQRLLPQVLRLTGTRDSGKAVSCDRGDGSAPQADDGEMSHRLLNSC